MTLAPAPALTLWALMCAGPAIAAPTSCEDLRATIEGRIRANGVGDAVVTIEDNTGAPHGKVVGTCQLGTKRLVYQARATGAAPAIAVAPAAPAAARRAPVITECDDGRVVTPGPCKR